MLLQIPVSVSVGYRSSEGRGVQRQCTFSFGVNYAISSSIFKFFFTFLPILTSPRHLQPLSQPRALPDPPLPGPVAAFPKCIFCQQPSAFRGDYTSAPSRLRVRSVFFFASTASRALHQCPNQKQIHAVGSNFIPISIFCPLLSCELPPARRPLAGKPWDFLTVSLLPEGVPKLCERRL